MRRWPNLLRPRIKRIHRKRTMIPQNRPKRVKGRGKLRSPRIHRPSLNGKRIMLLIRIVTRSWQVMMCNCVYIFSAISWIWSQKFMMFRDVAGLFWDFSYTCLLLCTYFNPVNIMIFNIRDLEFMLIASSSVWSQGHRVSMVLSAW